MDRQILKEEIIKRISNKLADQKIQLYHTKKIYNIRKKIPYTQKMIKTIIDTYWEVIAEAIADGDSVNIHGYGNIVPIYWEERLTYDPAEQKIYTLPGQYRIKFWSGKKLIEACGELNKKVSNQEGESECSLDN